MRRTFERLVALWALGGGAILLAVVAATALNVGGFALDSLARRFGGTVAGLTGYEDFVALATGAAAPMLLPWCQLRGGHVAVDAFAHLMPGWFLRTVDLLSLAAMAALALFLFHWMIFGMLETRADAIVAGVLGWPEWPFYLPGLVSLPLWAAAAGLGFVDRATAPA